MYRLTRSGGHFHKRLSVSCLESLALCLVTAVRLAAGAANVYPACNALVRVSVVNTAAYITVNALYLFLIH